VQKLEYYNFKHDFASRHWVHRMRKFLFFVCFFISTSCSSNQAVSCPNKTLQVQVVDLSMCIPSEKLTSINVLEGNDTSFLLRLRNGLILISKTDQKKAFNNLPSKLNKSNAEFLTSLFEGEDDKYLEMRPAFFMSTKTKLKVISVHNFSAYIIKNDTPEESRAYLVGMDDTLYEFQPVEGHIVLNDLLTTVAEKM